MKRIFTLSFIGLSLTFLLTTNSCKKENENNNNITCNRSVVTVNADITSPTVWEDCKVYLITASQISVKSTLTIQPGAIIKFSEFTGDNAILVSSSGTISAIGTTAKPIIFTSVKDDVNGGDTNGDGNATAPARGDWGGIVLNSNTSVFKNCKFLYGGEGSNGGLNQPTLEFGYSYGRIDSCTFAYCGGETTYSGYGVVDASYCQDERFSITNCIFYGCVKPINVNCFLSIDNSNTFHNPNNTSEKNQLNAIFMSADPNYTTRDVSWLETEVPFVLTGSMYLGSGYKLIVTNNVVVKMAFPSNSPGYNKIALNDKTSSIVGYNLSGVYFTSYTDDAHGGDANGDGASTTPSGNDWYGIQDISASINTNNHCYAWSNILYRAYP
jgi:hypothetical protein